MAAPMHSVTTTRRSLPWLGLLSALWASACKPTAGSDAPHYDVRDWSLDEIEAQLERNDDVLADAGIMVASASPAPAPAEYQPDREREDEGEDVPVPVPGADEDDLGSGHDASPDASDTELRQLEAEEVDAEPVEAAPEPMAPMDGSQRTSRSSRRSRMSAERPSRCERVCDLAEATCDLEAQICDLAQQHPDQPRYARACQRAELQCAAASRACQRCED